MKNIAIVAVAYNRCDSLQRLLASLERAYYDAPATLIISVDKSNTDKVELFADEYQWPHGDKIVDKHEKNLGLRPHMMSLGKWFNQFDAIIVLEDDIVVSPNFYTYTQQTVEKYSDCKDIAGISLYSNAVDFHTANPFQPIKDEHDVYFLQLAASWGEVWMRDSWRTFYEWYLSHQDFPTDMLQLPKTIRAWNSKSWLKYHDWYCVEENKYFVHPYVSLSTNFDEVGQHSVGFCRTHYQVVLQEGVKHNYLLPDFGASAVYYDGFFENVALYKALNMNQDELCIDLNGEWDNRLKRRYWLTTKQANYKIIRSFGLSFRPIDENILLDNPGENIYLYDTAISETHSVKKNLNEVILYHYRIRNIIWTIRSYGFSYTIRDLNKLIKHRYNCLKKRIKR